MEKSIYCDCCNYRANRNSDYNKHLKSKKHINNLLIFENNSKIKTNTSKTCKCGKVFLHYSSLYRHKKGCKIINNSDTNKINNDNLIDSTNTNNNYLDTIKKEIVQKNKIINNLFQQLEQKDNHINKLQQQINIIINK